MPKTLPKTLLAECSELMLERNKIEADLDLAIALVDWIFESKTDAERISVIAAWAAFNDSMEGEKFCWEFLKDSGLMRDDKADMKVEYRLYKKSYDRRWRRR